ncbi:MAG: polysaccharide ABC transporter ATP-binding protein [Sedimenticola sp.]
MSVVIKIENLSKYYRLGIIGGGTLQEDVSRWFAKLRGQPDPLMKVDVENHGNRKNGEIWALQNINLEVKEGEILGIIGNNGVGKSTLLKILSRITAPTSGRIKIKGRVSSLLEVGTGFHPELTGRENIYLNGAILGMYRREIDQKFDEIVDFSGIEEFVDTPVKRYSSGMLVRLAFAVAAHLEPEVLVVDEVLAVGDLQFQKKCLGKMQDVSRQGRTVLFVSHNMSAVENLCTKGVLLNQGRVAHRGDVAETIKIYIKSTHDSSRCPLGSRTDRQGNGNVRLREVVISSDGENDSDGFLVGSAINFHLRLNSRIRTGVRVIIGVYDFMNVGIMRFDSNLLGDELIIGEGDVSIHCITELVPIMPGSYFINIAILQQGGMEDYVTRAAYINFYPSDYFGSGRFYTNSDTKLVKFMVKHKWSIGDKTS